MGSVQTWLLLSTAVRAASGQISRARLLINANLHGPNHKRAEETEIAPGTGSGRSRRLPKSPNSYAAQCLVTCSQDAIAVRLQNKQQVLQNITTATDAVATDTVAAAARVLVRTTGVVASSIIETDELI